MLSLRDITLHRGLTRVLDDVSLDVQEGELVALIGANGAGKTTVLRTISGLLSPGKGTITFNGTPIHNAEPDAIVRLGVAHCPEERKIWPQMSVEEHLELGAFVRSNGSDVRADIARVFETFPVLLERRKQLAGTLSGGQQQMVAIGRALMAQPRLLLLDEPSLGLSPLIVQAMFGALRDVHASGTSMLLVEQNVAGALAIADRAYLLEEGRIVAEGTPDAVFKDPALRRAYLGVADGS